MVDPVSFLEQHGNSTVVPLRWENRCFYLLDQRVLPWEQKWLRIKEAEECAASIRDLVVRGAPAIGICAAFGMVLAVQGATGRGMVLKETIDEAAALLNRARPTAVNLNWAVERMLKAYQKVEGQEEETVFKAMEQEALSIWQEDIEANIAMGGHGAALIPDSGTILTHCNAGALATGGYGTALGVIRAAFSAGKDIDVLADETRPWLQGARLTAYELKADNIPVKVCVDSAAGFFMRQGKVQAVVVGADRIAANGDVANKIGTYSAAQVARANNIPFYVAAPASTLDINTPNGSAISIEVRDQSEVTTIAGKVMVPEGVEALNPVFDITPAELITAIITEKGVLRPPYDSAIASCFH